MKFSNCGFEHEKDFEYCPNCGAAAPKSEPFQTADTVYAEPVSINPAADKVLGALKDKLFLAICILMTAGCVLSIAASGLPIINILITVFLWLTYSSAQKGFANEKQLRCVSGTVYANYVIMNVACGILIACGVLFGLLFGLVADMPEVIDAITLELNKMELDIAEFSQELLTLAGWAVGIVFIIIAAIGLVVNLLGMRKIHRLAKSVYQGIMYQNPNFENPRGAKGWLIFFGVCAGITALSSISTGLVAALASGCSAASAIIAAILIDRHLVLRENNI